MVDLSCVKSGGVARSLADYVKLTRIRTRLPQSQEVDSGFTSNDDDEGRRIK